MPGKKKVQHHAYLLRCWQEGKAAADEKPHWRFCIEEVLQEQPRQGFDNLDALITFLRAELDDQDACQTVRARERANGHTGRE